MTYDAHIKDGAIVLDEPVRLPEGLAIKVMVPASSSEESPDTQGRGLTLLERLKNVVGSIEGPDDLAENHDHYLHGRPKK